MQAVAFNFLFHIISKRYGLLRPHSGNPTLNSVITAMFHYQLFCQKSLTDRLAKRGQLFSLLVMIAI